MTFDKTKVTQVLVLALSLALTGCPGPQASQPQPGSDPKTDTPGTKAGPSLDLKDAQTEIKGQIFGHEFSMDSCKLDSGRLVLEGTLKGHGRARLRVLRMNQKPGEVPTQQSFQAEADKPNSFSVHVWGMVKVDGRLKSQSQMVRKGFQLSLRFGAEAEGSVPGVLALESKEPAQFKLSGIFLAKITGFRLIDGKVDRRLDSLKTLETLTRENLQAQSKKPLSAWNAVGFRLSPAGPKGAWKAFGQGVVRFKEGDEKRFLRVQFVKDQGEWKLCRLLDKTQLLEAHPVDKAWLNSSPTNQLLYTTAKHIETELQKSAPNVGITRFQLAKCQSWTSKGRAYTACILQLETDKKLRNRRFLWAFKDGQWQFAKELNDDETVDWSTGLATKKK